MAMSLVLAGAFFLGTKLLSWWQNSFSSGDVLILEAVLKRNYIALLISLEKPLCS